VTPLSLSTEVDHLEYILLKYASAFLFNWAFPCLSFLKILGQLQDMNWPPYT
jgi:hypothetical protein